MDGCMRSLISCFAFSTCHALHLIRPHQIMFILLAPLDWSNLCPKEMGLQGPL